MKSDSAALDSSLPSERRAADLSIETAFQEGGTGVLTIALVTALEKEDRIHVGTIYCNPRGWLSRKCQPTIEWNAHFNEDAAGLRAAQVRKERAAEEEKTQQLQKLKKWRVGQRVCVNDRPGSIVSADGEEVVVRTRDSRYTMHPTGDVR